MVSGSVFADSALTTVDKANDIVLNVDGNKFYNVSVSEDIVNAGQILEDYFYVDKFGNINLKGTPEELAKNIGISVQEASLMYEAVKELPNVYERGPVAFQIANEAFEIYRQKLADHFPEDEIIRIAYHFINAEGENEVELVESIDKRKEILRNVEEVLKGYAIQRTKKNNHFYDRFMIHLNYFLDYLDRSRDDNQSLLDMEDHIKQSYPKAFEIGSKIYDVITQHTGLDLYKSERVYLVLHIQRLLS